MTATQSSSSETSLPPELTDFALQSSAEPPWPPEIVELKKVVENNPQDLVAKISLASALEQAGFLLEAAAQYEDLKSQDTDQVFRAAADKALGEIKQRLAKTTAGQGQDFRSYRQGHTAGVIEVKSPGDEWTTSLPAYSDTILQLQEAVDRSPGDIVARIALANALEEAGHWKDAAHIYEQIKALDIDGTFTGTAEKALSSLQSRIMRKQEESTGGRRSYRQGTEAEVVSRDLAQLERRYDLSAGKTGKLNFRQSLANLPIASKQFIAFLTCSTISVVAVVGAGMAIAIVAGRAQLKNQALSEVVVTEGNYNIKINQMGFGFRGQSDNISIIRLAQLASGGKPIPAPLKSEVRKILRNEANTRVIEYATLVNKNKKIVANAHSDRTGQIFDPDNKIDDLLANPRQLKFSSVVSRQELLKESPPNIRTLLGNSSYALIRYTLTPVRNPDTYEVSGILISGDVVNGKDAMVKDTVKAFGGGYSAVYFLNPDGKPQLATSALQVGGRSEGDSKQLTANVSLPDLGLIRSAQGGSGGNLTSRLSLQNQPMTMAIRSVSNSEGQPIAFLLRGTPENALDNLLRETFLWQLLVGVISLVIAGVAAYWLGRALTNPLRQLQNTAQRLGSGEKGIRADIESEDEVGQLARTINEMAQRVEDYTQSMESDALQRRAEAESQKQQKEELQAGVIRLLLSIEEAAKGDLTVKGQVETGAVGSIADAFNATLGGLRSLVQKVVVTANTVTNLAQSESEEVSSLSQNALSQSRSLQSATQAVVEMAHSIEQVATNAQTAAEIARQGKLTAQTGQDSMDQTVNSIYNIRGRVAEISKKSKRLAESSQEISKIVNIITGISEKTNLLAFNASIEAARAGENGQGFRIVADEVRRLAEMVTVSAQEIEQVILRIQEETAQMTQMMEESTSEVVTGTQLVQTTKENLQTLAQITEQIDTLLDSISQNTASQRSTSLAVTETMESVASLAQQTSNKSQTVSESLQSLTAIAADLQTAATQFKVDD